MNRAAYFQSRVRRALLVLGMFLQVGAAQAEWTSIGRTDIFRVYLDQKLIQRQGDFVQAWQLTDYTVAQWADARTAVGSIKHLLEFDCSQHRFRILVGIAYSEQMEAGHLLATEKLSDSEWMMVEPASTSEKVEQIVCSKK